MSVPFELNPTFSFTLLGTCAIYATTRPSWRAWSAVLLIALALRLTVTRAMGGLGAYYGVWWINWGAFLGIASLLVLAGQRVRARVQSANLQHKILREAFYAAAVFPLFSLLIGYALPPITRLRPQTLDAVLLQFDGSLGFQPSFILGRWLYAAPNCWGATTILYYALPFGASIVYASYLAARRSGRPHPVNILGLFLSLMAVGFTLYAVFPATGPAHAFSTLYPWHTPSLAQILPAQISALPSVVDPAPRNCMPSLHLAGALAILWNSGLWPRWGRMLAALYLLVTIFSTLALGEHYFIDLVVAVPFTLIFQAAWSASPPEGRPYRRNAIIVGAMLTVAWLCALRYGLRPFFVSPVISWVAIILTLAWSISAQNKLRKS